MTESMLTQAKEAVKIVDLNKLSREQREKAKAIADEINPRDTQGVIQYGLGAQKNISTFADTVLDQVRARDAGHVGETLTKLLLNVKEVDVAHLSDGGFLGRIPIIGGLFNKMKKFLARYDRLSVQIDKIVTELDKANMHLLKDVNLLDKMYDKNIDFLGELDVYIAAGQIKLQQVHDEILPEMKKKADASNEPMEVQALHDMISFADRLEKKLHDLKLSRMVAIQTSPQLRLIQSGNQALVEKIQSSIMNTIPLWKNQIVIAISLSRQQKALKLQQEVSKTTNDLLAKNAEMLKQGSIGIARESQRGVVDIETLKKTNADLIETIQETLRINQEGSTKRAQAEKELSELENQLKKKLAEIN